MLRTLNSFVAKHFGLPEVLPKNMSYSIDSLNRRILLLEASESMPKMMLPKAEIGKVPGKYEILNTYTTDIDCLAHRAPITLIGTCSEIAAFKAKADLIKDLYRQQSDSVHYTKDEEIKFYGE